MTVSRNAMSELAHTLACAVARIYGDNPASASHRRAFQRAEADLERSLGRLAQTLIPPGHRPAGVLPPARARTRPRRRKPDMTAAEDFDVRNTLHRFGKLL